MSNAQKKAAPAADKHRFLQFTISGSYYNSKKEIVDFDGLVGKIPDCDEDNGVGSMHVRGRFAEKWIREAVDADGKKKFPERVHKLRQVFVDDVQPTTGTLSFVGKNIKDLNVDEMQELAVAKDLRFIPLPGAGLSKRDMLTLCYVAYSEKVLLKKVKYQEEGFNFAKLPAITLTADSRRETSGKLTNDDIIALEQRPTLTELGGRDDPKARFTLAELKQVADSKQIEYPTDVSFDELYSHLFPAS